MSTRSKKPASIEFIAAGRRRLLPNGPVPYPAFSQETVEDGCGVGSTTGTSTATSTSSAVGCRRRSSLQ